MGSEMEKDWAPLVMGLVAALLVGTSFSLMNSKWDGDMASAGGIVSMLATVILLGSIAVLAFAKTKIFKLTLVVGVIFLAVGVILKAIQLAP